MVIYLGWGYVPGGDRAEVGQPCAGSFVSLLPFFFWNLWNAPGG